MDNGEEEQAGEISPQEVGKSQKTKILAITLVIIIITASLSYVYFSSPVEHPEDTLFNIVESLNNKDLVEFINQTARKYDNEYISNPEGFVQEMQEEFDGMGYFHVEVDQVNIRYSKDLSNNDNDAIKEKVNEIESNIDRDVSKYCLITYRRVEINNSTEHKKIMKDIFVKISGEWLLGDTFDEYRVEVDYDVLTEEGAEAGLVGYDLDIEVKNTDSITGVFKVSAKLVFTNGEEVDNYFGAVVPYVGATPSESAIQYGTILTTIEPQQTKCFYLAFVMPEGYEFSQGIYRIESYVYEEPTIDNEAPNSFIRNISPSQVSSSAISLTCNVTSNQGDDISKVSLYYYYSTDDIYWSGPYSSGYKEPPSGIEYNWEFSWSFSFSDGEGYYRFYSVAEDIWGNVEDAPVLHDARCEYTIIDPTPSGTKSWEFTTPYGGDIESIDASENYIAIGTGGTYIGQDYIHVFDVNGNIVWENETDEEVSYVKVHNDVIFATIGDQCLAFDNTGNVLWTLPYTITEIEIQNNLIFASSWNKMYCIYLNGTVKWDTNIGYKIEVFDTSQTNIAITTDDEVFCLDISGNIEWQYHYWSTNNVDVIIANNSVIAFRSGELICWDLEGHLIWQIDTDGKYLSVIEEDIFAAFYSTIARLDVDGTIVWENGITYDNYYPDYCTLNSQILIVDNDGEVFAMDFDGIITSKYTIDGWNGGEIAASNGILYAAWDDNLCSLSMP